jgi:hypothetical protein
MGEYLIGSNGAHQRYRPDDMKATDCRKRMQVSPVRCQVPTINFVCLYYNILKFFRKYVKKSSCWPLEKKLNCFYSDAAFTKRVPSGQIENIPGQCAAHPRMPQLLHGLVLFKCHLRFIWSLHCLLSSN